jgi:hypothetical protein
VTLFFFQMMFTQLMMSQVVVTSFRSKRYWTLVLYSHASRADYDERLYVRFCRIL